VKQCVTLQDLYKQFHHQIDFFWIYAQEARASDTGLGKSSDPTPLTPVKNHRNIEHRKTAAAKCTKTISCEIPQLLDDLDNTVTIRYRGHPTRLYIIGADGKIAYAGEQGPFKTDLKAFESHLKKAATVPQKR